MLIEIHMIQNHSPSNLNRDDLGAPKTCIFGGVTRARISSQCLKRSIRRSDHFQAALERDGGIRTRSLVRELARRVHGNGEPPKELIERIKKVFEDGGVLFKEVKGDPDAMKILFFVPESDIQRMADAIKAVNDGDFAGVIASILRESARVPDIALSGRMTEFNAKGALDHINFTVEAALQAAHAISTHAVVNEVDYWTAADDLPSGQGAAMVEEATFNSACFYKYFCIDWDQLMENLGNDNNAKKLAACTLGHFIRAAAMTTPSGKQNSFASHTEPCGILVEIKKNGKHPTSYANAFADPVERIGKWDDDGPDYVSLEGRSIAKFGDHIFNLRKAYAIDSTLLWYAMPLYRFPLQGWEREPDGRKAKITTDKDKPPVQFASRCFDALGSNGDKKPGLIEAVIEEIGMKWADVKDVGKAQPPGAAS
jgi:CRISPR system Cascade subunit CasC